MRFLLAAVAIVSTVSLARAQTLPGLDAVVGRGELRVGMIAHDDPPMITTSEDGSAAGYDAEIAAAIADALGVTLTVVRTEDTYDGVVDQVARGEVDIAVSYLTRTVERARKVLFTRPYLTENLTVMLNRVEAAKRKRRCPTQAEFIDDLALVRVGVEDHTAFIGQLRALNPEANLVTYPTGTDVVNALRAGEVAMSFDGEVGALAHLAEDPSLRVFALFCALPGWREDIAVAVDGSQPALVPFIDVLLDRMHLLIEDGAVSMTTGPWATAR